MIASLSELLAAGALRTSPVSVCGVTVNVRELSVGDRSRIAKAAKDDTHGLAALLVELCAVDDSGAPLFSNSTADQIAHLRPELIDGIAAKALELSGLGEKPGNV